MARRPDDPRHPRSSTEPRTEPEPGHAPAEGGNGRHRGQAEAPGEARREVREVELVASDGNGSAIAALVLGLLGLTLAFMVFPAIAAVLMGIAAIVFGAIGLRNANRLAGLHKGLSVTGLITGVLALLLGGAVIVGGIALVDEFRDRIDVEELQLPDDS